MKAIIATFFICLIVFLTGYYVVQSIDHYDQQRNIVLSCAEERNREERERGFCGNPYDPRDWPRDEQPGVGVNEIHDECYYFIGACI
jgi:small nuclear ribonucleoprotein (snRNP)-like protein